MNQQINLYLPEFRKEKDPLAVINMLVIIGVFLGVLALVSAAKMYGVYRLNQDVAAKQGVLQTARNNTNTLVDSYGVQSEDPRLAEEVVQLEENLKGKRALLTFLDGHDIGNTGGFSEFLADLSRFHVEGLRLTAINLREGGKSVVLHGEVNRAENVPMYLQNLRNGESYSGKTFETLRIANESAAGEIDTRMVFDVATTGAVAR